jgi:hypothetical protein
VKGETLFIVSGGIEPDVFTEPFHSLNFNMNKTFGSKDQWRFNFSVNNILLDKREWFYKRDFSSAEGNPTAEFQSWSPGISFGAGISYSL